MSVDFFHIPGYNPIERAFQAAEDVVHLDVNTAAPITNTLCRGINKLGTKAPIIYQGATARDLSISLKQSCGCSATNTKPRVLDAFSWSTKSPFAQGPIMAKSNRSPCHTIRQHDCIRTWLLFIFFKYHQIGVWNLLYIFTYINKMYRFEKWRFCSFHYRFSYVSRRLKEIMSFAV